MIKEKRRYAVNAERASHYLSSIGGELPLMSNASLVSGSIIEPM